MSDFAKRSIKVQIRLPSSSPPLPISFMLSSPLCHHHPHPYPLSLSLPLKPTSPPSEEDEAVLCTKPQTYSFLHTHTSSLFPNALLSPLLSPLITLSLTSSTPIFLIPPLSITPTLPITPLLFTFGLIIRYHEEDEVVLSTYTKTY